MKNIAKVNHAMIYSVFPEFWYAHYNNSSKPKEVAAYSPRYGVSNWSDGYSCEIHQNGKDFFAVLKNSEKIISQKLLPKSELKESGTVEVFAADHIGKAEENQQIYYAGLRFRIKREQNIEQKEVNRLFNLL